MTNSHARDAYFSAANRPQPTSAPVVLLAEDDDDMRALVAQALRRDGCEVVEASNGVALALALSLCPRVDLVIADLRMPVLGGLEVVRRLRDQGGSAAVIVMTAFAAEDVRAEAEDLGALLFEKPFDLDDLRTAVLHLFPNAVAISSRRLVATGPRAPGETG